MTPRLYLRYQWVKFNGEILALSFQLEELLRGESASLVIEYMTRLYGTPTIEQTFRVAEPQATAIVKVAAA